MGLYSNGISGLSPMGLKVHESNARNMANEYKKIAIKLESLKSEQIEQNIKKYLEQGKDNWNLAYKSEGGNVKSIIDTDIKTVIEQTTDLISNLGLIKTQAMMRSHFYETLAGNCASEYTKALNECNSSDNDFWNCAKFSISAANVTYTISGNSGSHSGGGHNRSQSSGGSIGGGSHR